MFFWTNINIPSFWVMIHVSFRVCIIPKNGKASVNPEQQAEVSHIGWCQGCCSSLWLLQAFPFHILERRNPSKFLHLISDTLPETNIAPEKWLLGDYFVLCQFQGGQQKRMMFCFVASESLRHSVTQCKIPLSSNVFVSMCISLKSQGPEP